MSCKHLDYDEKKYGEQCELVTRPDGLRYWKRLVVPYPDCSVNVQFCGLGRGRINNPAACWEPPGACPQYEEEKGSVKP